MLLLKTQSIKYYQFNSFQNKGVYHAIFTRRGGVSPAPWESLNFGASVGDDIKNVQLNKQIALGCLGVGIDTIYDAYQVHSCNVIQAFRPMRPGEPHEKADALITNVPGVSLLMRFADCVPIMLFDPVHRAIGITHAGWKGTVQKIAEYTVQLMQKCFNTNPLDIQAGIGPAIGPDHYSIMSDVIEQVKANFGPLSGDLLLENHGKKHLDLWKANQMILTGLGVHEIEIAEICTACNVDDWYSHRAKHGTTGRFGAVIGLSR